MEQFVNDSFTHLFKDDISGPSLKLIWAANAGLINIGKMLACFFTTYLAERIGRRGLFLFTVPWFILSFVMPCVAHPTNNFVILSVSRLLNGIHVGIVAIMAPIMLAEIAVLPSRRVVLSRLHNIMSLVGTLFAVIFGIPEILGNPTHWLYLSLVPLPFIFVEFVWLLWKAKESPTYLYGHSNKTKAQVRKSLVFYLGTDAAQDLDMDKIVRDKKNGKLTRSEFLAIPAVRKAIILAIVLAIACVFSGSSILTHYSTAMFAGFGEVTVVARLGTIMSNVISICLVISGIYLINRFGRKPMLLFGIYLSMLCLICMFIFAFFSHTSLNAKGSALFWCRFVAMLVWPSVRYFISAVSTLIVMESVENQYRTFVLSVHKLCVFTLSAITAVAFPPIAVVSEPVAYSVMLVPFLIAAIYITYVCPETKHVIFIKELTPATTAADVSTSVEVGTTTVENPLICSNQFSGDGKLEPDRKT